MADQRRVKPGRHGRFDLRLTREERDVLRSLPGQLREILPTGDPSIGRLFPPGYSDDPQRNEEYRQLVHEDLMSGHLESLRVMESTVDARRLTHEELEAWLGALNDLRLVLGAKLDVTEETYQSPVPQDDPNAAGLALYFYLGWLQEQVVEALAAGVDPAGREGPAESEP